MANFKHCNRDGSWHSICLSCYRTAATGDSRELFSQAETSHQCDVEILVIAERLRHRLLIDGWNLREVVQAARIERIDK
jgi:hypothetical protein